MSSTRESWTVDRTVDADFSSSRRVFDERINVLAGEGAVLRVFASNLRAEQQVSQSTWRAFLAEFLRTNPTAVELRRTFRRFCHKRPELTSYVGSVISDGHKKVFFRVQRLDRLCDALVEQMLFSDSLSARRVIVALEGKPIDAYPRALRTALLSNRAMWSAYDDPELSDLDESQFRAEPLMCRLGLVRARAGQETLLLRCRLPEGITAHTPTVFDAYRKPHWSYYFRVADECISDGSWRGRTHPREDCSELAGFPEAVHEPLSFEALSGPLRVSVVEGSEAP